MRSFMFEFCDVNYHYRFFALVVTVNELPISTRVYRSIFFISDYGIFISEKNADLPCKGARIVPCGTPNLFENILMDLIEFIRLNLHPRIQKKR